MAYKNDWKARQKKIDTPPKSKAGYTATDTEDRTDAPNVAKSVSARGDLGSKKSVVKSHAIKGGPQEPQTKTPTKITPKKDDGPSKRVQTAFQKRQNQLKQAAIEAKKDPKPKKKKTTTELSREYVKEKKEKSALDKQTDALVAEKESGRRLPKHLQKQKKVTAKKRVYPDPNKKPKPVVSTKKRVYPEPKKTVPVKKTDRAISKSANVEAPDEKTATVKVIGKQKTKKVTTPEPKTNGSAQASKRATAKDAKAETGSAAKMSDRPEDRGQRKDYDHFLSSRGGIKGFQRNLFGKNKTVAEASKAAKEAYDREQIDRKRPGQSDHYQYGTGRRSQKKKGGTIKAKTGGAIKRTYNTGGTIRFKSGGAVVDTYDY